MNTTRTPLKGILVIAGLLDPAGDIGTQCRYDLLPIPWNHDEFSTRVSNMIRVELGEKTRIEFQAIGFPHDSSDAEALKRGIGLRAWLTTNDSSPHTSELFIHGWTEKRGERAAKEIDQIAFHARSVDYSWPNHSPNDEIAISQFELVLLSQLESCEQAIRRL